MLVLVAHLALGAAAAGVTIGALRALGPRRERLLWSVLLAGAAGIYVAFAALAKAPVAGWLAIEAAGVVAYGAAAILGARRSPWLLALGWAAHAGWDALLHGGGRGPFVPEWYRVACLSFDLVAAAYLAARARAWVAASRAAP